MLGARVAFALNKNHPQILLQEKGQFGGTERSERRSVFFRGRQIAYMMHDYFRVTGAHDTVMDYADSFSVTIRNDDVQDFETRRDEVLLSMLKIPADDILGSVHKLRKRESAQLRNCVRNCMTWKFIKRYRCPNVRS